MARVLVTGIAGFIMSHVAEWLVRRGHYVIGLDDLSGGFLENIPDGVEFIRGSINHEHKVKWLFDNKRVDIVVHGAAYAAENLSHHVKCFNYQNNLIGTTMLLNEAVNHDCRGFVGISSIAVYGAGQVPFDESMTPHPEDSYGIAKLAMEQELRVTHAYFGLPYIIFRPFNVYGPRQNIGDGYRNVVGIFMRQCMEEKPMTIFGDGEQRRAFSCIDDVAPIIAESIDTPGAWGETFNIGAEQTYTVNELATEVARAMGTVVYETEHLPARKEVKAAYSKRDKLQSVFGQHEPTPLRDGLTKMAEWAKRRGIQPVKPFANIEVRKNLPPSWATLGKGELR